MVRERETREFTEWKISFNIVEQPGRVPGGTPKPALLLGCGVINGL
jgi:hypothetical protein